MGDLVIVTGAASGIGAALSRALAARGNTVVLADLAPTEALAKELDGIPEHVDVTDADDVRRLVEESHRRHGPLHAIYNNAGIGAGGPAHELDLATWRRVIDVDLMGVVYGVAAAYPLFVEQGFGHIINTASLAGLTPAPFLTPYAAAKHGVVGLSLTLRVEAATHGVGVTVVCPGPVETPMIDGIGRVLLAAMGEPYDADLLAADVLAGVDANVPLVVAPQIARTVWEHFRADPEGTVDAMIARLSLGG